MTYRHATVRDNHTGLASGTVLYPAPGFPAFPVRLARGEFVTAIAEALNVGCSALYRPLEGDVRSPSA
ncbi:hypothetical protein [Streptosporangium sp. NPDC000396]|uniref:hypothetical protein n=1 Tax=Streptosporangium sp. NPDC000396 TaxID=3366185 RepID=UPI0036B134BF